MKCTESGLFVPDEYAHGSGKVELFNERDKLIERVPFENFISARQLLDQKWWIRQIYGGGIETLSIVSNYSAVTLNGHAVTSPKMYYAHYNDQAPRELMTWLNLTDNSDAVDPANERRLKGNVVGYADKSLYVGSDAKRGSFNQIESTRTTSLARWVFDWPTSAGNGTFRSINWAVDNQTATVSPEWSVYSGYLLPPGITGQSPTDLRGYSWVAGSGQSEFWSTHVYTGGNPVTEGQKVTRRRLSDGVVLASFTQPVNAEAICDAGDGLWLGWWSDNTLRKYDYSGAAITSFALAAPPDGVNYCQGLAFDASTGHILVARSSGRYIQEYTQAGALVANHLVLPAGQGTIKIGLSSSTLVVEDSIAISIVDTSTWTVLYRVASATQGYGIMTNDNATTLWEAGNGILYNSRFVGNLATRALLPADVTKTNLQTMKITYEFDFS